MPELKTPVRGPHCAHPAHDSPLDPLHDDFTDEPHRLRGETLGANALPQRNNPMGGDGGQEQIEAGAVDSYIVAGEGNLYMLAVALGIHKLMPGDHQGLLSKHDLERCGPI